MARKINMPMSSLLGKCIITSSIKVTINFTYTSLEDIFNLGDICREWTQPHWRTIHKKVISGFQTLHPARGPESSTAVRRLWRRTAAFCAETRHTWPSHHLVNEKMTIIKTQDANIRQTQKK
ncbi:hypothetical protein PoB_003752100 [Plakobranchus ocellatus]|uniref:Uncharacterized protein n=1 Tax=Plakobranchus ocellatus TaxID=259542 RepID=A0AAV4AS66_9GAST|nr:hypothetical protein PoB_003752100 [Plakobranchus ocellatus]